MSFFLDREPMPELNPLHLVSVSLVSFYETQILNLSLSYMTLTLLKSTGQLFCTLSLTLVLSNVFS